MHSHVRQVKQPYVKAVASVPVSGWNRMGVVLYLKYHILLTKINKKLMIDNENKILGGISL